MRFLTINSGCNIAELKIPKLDLDIPYEAPKEVKIIAEAAPRAPKNDYRR